MSELTIGGVTINPGERQIIDVRVAPMYMTTCQSQCRWSGASGRAPLYLLALLFTGTKSMASK
jgi:hypothetical protein